MMTALSKLLSYTWILFVLLLFLAVAWSLCSTWMFAIAAGDTTPHPDAPPTSGSHSFSAALATCLAAVAVYSVYAVYIRWKKEIKADRVVSGFYRPSDEAIARRREYLSRPGAGEAGLLAILMYARDSIAIQEQSVPPGTRQPWDHNQEWMCQSERSHSHKNTHLEREIYICIYRERKRVLKCSEAQEPELINLFARVLCNS